MRSSAGAPHHRVSTRALSLFLAGAILGGGSHHTCAQRDMGARTRELPYQKLGPMMDNLPAGSMLRDVRIPIFDKRLERMALLQSRFLKVVTKRDLVAENIALRYFQDDSILIRMTMGSADFSLTTGVLTAHQAVTLDTEKLKGGGTGGVFHLESRSGFVRGPAFSRLISERPQKVSATRIDTPAPIRGSPPILSPLATAFTGPEGLTGRERRIVDSLLEARTKSVIANRAPTRNFMTQSRQFIGRAEADLRSFSNTVELSEARLLANLPKRSPDTLLPKQHEGEIVITAEGGIFLNPERGHISYLRNIRILDPRFTLTGGGHLRVFFPPQELTRAIQESEQPSDSGEASPDRGSGDRNEKTFSELVDPYLFVVSGGVRMELSDRSRMVPPVVATGETVVIDRRTGDIVLQGGTPCIKQGLNSLTAGHPDLYLRLYQNGDVYAEEGPWTTTGDLSSGKIFGEETRASSPDAARDNSPGPVVTVSCHGGLYLDASEGQVVYLKDIRVLHPEFRVEAKDEMKMFLGKKAGISTGPETFSDIEYVVASGDVRLIQDTGDDTGHPVTATAEHAIVDVKSENILLKGGAPFLGLGDNFLRAGKPDLYLRIYGNGSLFAEAGPWTTSGKLSKTSAENQQSERDSGLIAVTCEGGLAFDALKGQIVYLGEIVAEEPRFRLRCDKSMRITLERSAEGDEDPLEGPEAFSEVDKIVALGNVMISRIPEAGSQPVVARSAAATYEASSGTLALRGGRPAIRQGNSFFEAQEDGLYILFYANGSFELSRGAWEQFFDLRDKNFEKLRQRGNDR